jgi:rod shape-determining protein MreD
MITAIKTVLVTMLVVAVQITVFPDLRASGVMPELVLAAAIAAGTQGGQRSGAVVGFFAGLLYDAQLPTAFGLYALTGCLIGYGVGAWRSGMADSVGKVSWVISLLEMAGAVTLLVVCSQLLGGANFYPGVFGRTLIIASMYTAVFLPLLHRLYRFALIGGDDRSRPLARLRLVG